MAASTRTTCRRPARRSCWRGPSSSLPRCPARVARGLGRRRWVPDRLLAIVAGLPDAQLHAALREAVEQQLLVVDRSGRGYGFRHALARAAIPKICFQASARSCTVPTRRRSRTTPSSPGPDLDASSMLAHHWLVCARPPRALPASVRAGRAYRRCFAAPSAAQRHFELSARALDPGNRTRQSALGSTMRSCSRPPRQRRCGRARDAGAGDRRSADIGYEGTLERRATLLVLRAVLLADLGRDGEGLAVLEQAWSCSRRTYQAGSALRCSPRSLARSRASITRARGRVGDARARSGRGRRRHPGEARGSSHPAPAMIYGGDVEAGLP